MTRIFQPTRRDVIRAVGAAALMGLPAGHSPLWSQAPCAVLGSPSLTEGPYFVDEELNRSDIRLDPSDNSMRPGTPLALAINVSKKVDCGTVPLTGAYVDIWHCDASGVYSDVAAQSSTGKKFLRGFQSTNRQGNVYFTTIYPGWYPGRAVHIHIKVRLFDGLDQTYEFTSQFFFNENFTDAVYKANSAYPTRARDTLNTTDGIYMGASATGSITSNSGSFLMLDARDKTNWIEADAKLVCDLSLGSSPDQPGGGGPGGGPGGPPPGPRP
ncbi:MAG: hypothetical protein U0Q16_34195 [Bryobacteraceae bacterium]